MSSTTLMIGVALDLATAVWLVVVGVWLHRRLEGRSIIEQALRRSLLFWYGAAGFMLLDGGYALLTMGWDVPRWMQVGVLLTRRWLFVVGTGALVHLLLTMRSGTARHVPALMAYYAALTVVVEVVTLYQFPDGHDARVWSIQFVAARDTPLWLNITIGAGIFVPLGVAALRALALWSGLSPGADRYYLGVFCYSILTFVVGVLIGFVDNTWYWYGLFENRLVFAVALGMWIIMYPPWLARRMGIRGLRDLRRFPHAHGP